MKKQNNKKREGLFMLYVGAGKGKTTTVMGSAVRAAGTGMNVFIIQFIKGEWPNGERDFFVAYKKIKKYHQGKPKLGKIDFEQGGRGFVKILGDKKPFSAHQKAARAALKRAKEAMLSGKYDVIIMDEAISAIEEKLLKVVDLVKFVKLKPRHIHLMMTGHTAPKSLAAKADLISDIKMVKHPYYKGVLAQKGIDF